MDKIVGYRRQSKAAHANTHKRLAINTGEVLRESILGFPSPSPVKGTNTNPIKWFFVGETFAVVFPLNV